LLIVTLKGSVHVSVPSTRPGWDCNVSVERKVHKTPVLEFHVPHVQHAAIA
jgi:hypothetical protein